MTDRVAFVHYPHLQDDARLETMPFALNSVLALAETGWEVDLFLWERDLSRYAGILPGKVRVLTLTSFNEARIRHLERPSRLNRLRRMRIAVEVWRLPDYACVFGVGQLGAHMASQIARRSGSPWVYYNDEFPSAWEQGVWFRLEREAARAAALIVVPDPQRFQPLCEELGIDGAIPHAALPNVTNVRPHAQAIDWHSRLGLPHGSVPFLNAGLIADSHQIPELLCTVPRWPDRAILILHGRSPLDNRYRSQLSHLDIPARIIWSSNPMPEDELNSLVGYCAGNFGLYRNTGANVEYTGYSSGKLMRSIACGSPVIASRFPSLSFIEDYKLGMLVGHPLEIPEAVAEILRDNEGYRARCRKFSSEQLSFEDAWRVFCDCLADVAGVDLTRPSGREA